MDKFKTVVNIANKQGKLGFGLVALLTAGGEQIFSSVAFRCPCSDLNLLYGLVFLLVPALALLLLGFILSKRTWKLVTGLCPRGGVRLRRRRRSLLTACVTLLQVSATALVAPGSWVAVALLNGNYYECAMTGANVSAYNLRVCDGKLSEELCRQELFRLPCKKSAHSGEEEVLRTLRAHSQILGWLLIAAIMLSNLLLICAARCRSPISYQQLQFWSAYTEEENELLRSFTAKHARELADRNLRSFFSGAAPEEVVTPSNGDWEQISALYRFSTKDHYYSTLHQHVERDGPGGGRVASVRSTGSADPAPTVLGFVDGGMVSLPGQ